jgi:hypothetical protein
MVAPDTELSENILDEFDAPNAEGISVIEHRTVGLTADEWATLDDLLYTAIHNREMAIIEGRVNQTAAMRFNVVIAEMKAIRDKLISVYQPEAGE